MKGKFLTRPRNDASILLSASRYCISFLRPCSTILAFWLKGCRKNVKPERNILARRLFRMHAGKGHGVVGTVTEWGKGTAARVVPGNFTEWRNNVSYATFPEWRAVGGAGGLQILTAQETKNESAIGRVETAGKRGGDAVTLWHAIRS